MAPETLSIDDSRIEHCYIDVGDGITYHYIVVKPQKYPVATILLLHGWPDLAYGWRFQVPYLLNLGLQVVVPDMLGYGETSAPESLTHYSLKSMSNHIAQLITSVSSVESGTKSPLPVIIGAHDWGAFLAWRLALYSPELVRAIFCFCVPFTPPQQNVVPLGKFVQGNPVFTYQLQNAQGEAETLASRSPEHLRGFVKAMFGGVTAEGLPGFDPHVGLLEDRLLELGPSPLLAPEVMEHYVSQFSRSGLRGPMNWYRTRAINGEEELSLAKNGPFRFEMPAMIVMAGQDPALTPDLADGQEQYFPKGLKKGLIPEASHWILIHFPDECNKFIGNFLEEVLNVE